MPRRRRPRAGTAPVRRRRRAAGALSPRQAQRTPPQEPRLSPRRLQLGSRHRTGEARILAPPRPRQGANTCGCPSLWTATIITPALWSLREDDTASPARATPRRINLPPTCRPALDGLNQHGGTPQPARPRPKLISLPVRNG